MSGGMRFTPDRRHAWLKLVEAGHTQADACRELSVAKQTVANWLSKGRKSTEGPAFEFAQAFDAIPRPPRRRRALEVNKAYREGRLNLSRDDLIGLLEDFAVNDRSVTAAKLLIDLLEQKNADSIEENKPASLADQLAIRRARKTGTG
jgi:hypothetical protein